VSRKLLITAALTAAAALIAAAPAGAQAIDTRLSYQAPPGETGKVAVDGSGQGNDGVLRGGVTRVHGVYKFHRVSADGKYDRITAPDSPSLNPGLSPFTFSVRMKVSPKAEWSNTEMAVIRHGDSDAPGGDYKMELRKNPTTGAVAVFCSIHDDDGVGHGYVRGRGGLKSIADNRWHTVACSRVDADTVSLRVDQKVVERQTRGDLGNVQGDVPMLIGCQLKIHGPQMREQFVGKLDNISVTVQ